MKLITRADAIRHLYNHSAIDDQTHCWSWTASLTKDGYPQISNQHVFTAYQTRGAHRLSKMLHDDWTPASRAEQTRHLCHNRGCINPEHLLTGSAKDNAADRIAAGRQHRGENHPRAKVSDADCHIIRSERAAGVSARELADRFSISMPHVYVIGTGKARRVH